MHQDAPVAPMTDEFSRGLSALKEVVDRVSTPHSIARVLQEIAAFLQIFNLPLRDQDVAIITPFRGVVDEITRYARIIAGWSIFKRYAWQYPILSELFKFRRSLNELFLAAIVINSVPSPVPNPGSKPGRGKSSMRRKVVSSWSRLPDRLMASHVKNSVAAASDSTVEPADSPALERTASGKDKNDYRQDTEWFWEFFDERHPRNYIRQVLQRTVEDLMRGLDDHRLLGYGDMSRFRAAVRQGAGEVDVFMSIAETSGHIHNFKIVLFDLMKDDPVLQDLLKRQMTTSYIMSRPTGGPPYLENNIGSALLQNHMRKLNR
ncbi:hypothetical protein B0H16DRAFT_868460 [Mycena metata]|uniref:Uncharacterized protein n=1 Tax=Mycena metata TaxID=1033252 RepID=A0AAD7IVM0_9AGAR|nr:hypothetical protein B0H16DRAFT_901900 [Mycena metata]KAJ7749639.1 hypothetical protein B0H16DRAFT_868460 [Mycena metata]